MRTAQQWLGLPKDERALELGRVLTPEPWKHGELELSYQDEDQFLCCAKCDDKIYQVWEGGHAGVKRLAPRPDSCSVPDRITIDSNTAMKERDKATSGMTTAFTSIMYEIWNECVYGDSMEFEEWLAEHAQPEHYLIAAAMAAERKEE